LFTGIILEDWMGQYNLNNQGNEIRVNSRYINARLANNYMIYSSQSNRNIAYNTGNTLSSNTNDYNSEIYQIDDTLGSINISTWYYDKNENDNNRVANSTWYIEYPMMHISNENLQSVTFYTSLFFSSISAGKNEYFYLQIKPTSESWISIQTPSSPFEPINTSQSFLYLERDDINDNNVLKYEIDLTSRILSFNNQPFNIRLLVFNFQDNDYVEIGSYLIKYTFYE
jgi:hypothetical protein